MLVVRISHRRAWIQKLSHSVGNKFTGAFRDGKSPHCARSANRLLSSKREQSEIDEDRPDPGAYILPDPELAVPAQEIVLASRPASGSPVTAANFRQQAYNLKDDAPVGRVPPGHVLVKTLWLSVDPFMRCRFNEDTGVDYTARYEVDEPITSAGLGYVQLCGQGVTEFSPGEIVIDPFDSWPWRSDAMIQANKLTKVPQSIEALIPMQQLLGTVGLSGLTALHGVRDAGRVGSDDVVVVSGAAGSVGLNACQLSLEFGAKVIGICGTNEKAQFLTDKVGCHAAVVYSGKTEDELATALKTAIRGLQLPDAAPDTEYQTEVTEVVDAVRSTVQRVTGKGDASVYFDNVGGLVSEAVIPLLGPGGRVVLCGQISMYNTDEDYPPPVSPKTAKFIAHNDIERERYLVLDYAPEFGESLAELCHMVSAGKLQTHETVTHGLNSAPDAFVEMMGGGNIGKALVRCADPPPSVVMYTTLRNLFPCWFKGHLANAFATSKSFSPM